MWQQQYLSINNFSFSVCLTHLLMVKRLSWPFSQMEHFLSRLLLYLTVLRSSFDYYEPNILLGEIVLWLTCPQRNRHRFHEKENLSIWLAHEDIPISFLRKKMLEKKYPYRHTNKLSYKGATEDMVITYISNITLEKFTFSHKISVLLAKCS